MNNRIRFASGTTFPQPEQAAPPVSPLTSGREWRRIAVIATVEEAKAAFADGAQYAQVWDSVIVREDESGAVIEETVEESRDLSEWSFAGEIVDHRDGTVTVLMGKPTEVEQLQRTVDEQSAALAILFGEAE